MLPSNRSTQFRPGHRTFVRRLFVLHSQFFIQIIRPSPSKSTTFFDMNPRPQIEPLSPDPTEGRGYHNTTRGHKRRSPGGVVQLHTRRHTCTARSPSCKSCHPVYLQFLRSPEWPCDHEKCLLAFHAARLPPSHSLGYTTCANNFSLSCPHDS